MSSTATASSRRPFPLKQRTSSIDTRRDYNTQTWTSLIGLLKLREFLITVDHFSIWKRHLAWAIEDGKDLKEYMTQRHASSMIFMSLLLSTELSVLFNSAGVTTQVRQSLMQERFETVSFWVGILIILSAVLTLLSLISTFTAWTMVSAVSEANAHCIFRSSIGQYVAELPGRFIVGSIYSFMLWLILFFFLLLPVGFWSMMLLIFAVALFVHTITAFSAFGRVVMHTGAMGSKRIFDASYEASLLPHSLHGNLLTKAQANLANKTSILRQYRSKIKPIDRDFSFDELSGHLSEHRSSQDDESNRSSFDSHSVNYHGYHMDQSQLAVLPSRKRTGSLVKFADGFDTSGEPFKLDNVTAGSTKTLRHTEISVPHKPSATPLSALTSWGDVTRTPVPAVPRPPRPDSRLPVNEPVHNEPRSAGGGNHDVANESTHSNDVVEKWLSPHDSFDELSITNQDFNEPPNQRDRDYSDLFVSADCSASSHSFEEEGSPVATVIQTRRPPGGNWNANQRFDDTNRENWTTRGAENPNLVEKDERNTSGNDGERQGLLHYPQDGDYSSMQNRNDGP